MIDFNDDPTIAGPTAPGSGIFLHAWMADPTAGMRRPADVSELLRVLRWLNPSAHPVIEIGTSAEIGVVDVSQL